MSPRIYSSAVAALAVVFIAASVWLSSGVQREAARTAHAQSQAVEQMLVAMLDQETGARGYALTGNDAFLQPWRDGATRFERGLADARALAGSSDPRSRALIDRSANIVARWRRSSEDAVATTRAEGADAVTPASRYLRKGMMDEFRRLNTLLREHIERRGESRAARAGQRSVVLVLLISAAFAFGGWLTFGRRFEARARRDRAETARRTRQADFAHSLQFMDSEEGAHELVKRHLESALPGSEVVVMQRNNSGDRLQPAIDIDPATPLAMQLVDAAPRDCLAMRLGNGFEGGDPDALLQCGICGKTEQELTTCTPLLVGGEVIGSVLVSHDEPLDDDAGLYIDDTVTQAAPVVANMRNLALAEMRAATDALTGLPNRCAIQDTLRRMVAQAGRSGLPLTAVAIDLDHFKSINDRYGHDKGDDVLAAAAEALASTARVSDFIGRQGGEEFVALLPDTDLDGGLVAAENLRRAVSRIKIEGVEQPIWASFGVAVLPLHALDADDLVRRADRALYAAKEHGRDRVETATAGAAASPQILA